MLQVLVDAKTGLHFRPETYDLAVAKEVSSYRALMPKKGGRLLDVGGNIGVVSRWWLKNGGKSTVAVEPEPDNLKLLRKNLAEFGDRAMIVPKAAVSKTAPLELSFYLNNGINKGSHTIRPTRGREEIKVRTITFAELLSRYSPDALKMDIEGGEMELREEIISLPRSIDRFAIEWHLSSPKTARAQAIEMDASLKSKGWRCVYGNNANMSGKTWHVTRVYHR